MPRQQRRAAERATKKAAAKTVVANEPKRINAEDLDDRQVRGWHRLHNAERTNAQAITLNDSTTFWRSKRGNRSWEVKREQKNHRGELSVAYVCSCGDYQKNGRTDCEHIFAERLRRDEVVVVGTVERKRLTWATQPRRPARKIVTPDGRSMSTVSRHTRAAIPERVPELLRDLARAMAHIYTEETK